MTFCVIDADGQLHQRDQRPTLAAINAVVGEPAHQLALIDLRKATAAAALTPDAGDLPQTPVVRAEAASLVSDRGGAS